MFWHYNKGDTSQETLCYKEVGLLIPCIKSGRGRTLEIHPSMIKECNSYAWKLINDLFQGLGIISLTFEEMYINLWKGEKRLISIITLGIKTSTLNYK